VAKAVKQNIDPEKIAALLAGEMQTDELTSHEKRAWLDRFTDIMGGTLPGGSDHFRRARGPR
jgi:hypothetical protein